MSRRVSGRLEVDPVREAEEHARIVRAHRLRDTYGGYEWGDPVRLFYPRRPVFTEAQVAVAVRAVRGAS